MDALQYIKKLEGFIFHIDKYQRGYRWGIREIYSLLDDIYSFDAIKENFYCLQPLVVKVKSENNFELIDGQQRATTIYLILKFLLNTDFYQLKYETRGNDEGNNTFLEQLNVYIIPDFLDIKIGELDKSISNYWKNDFLTTNQVYDSVDNFYFFKAYCAIKHWFSLKKEEDKGILEHNLLNKTKVIWYVENNAEVNVTNTFINFNDGKISLDQAELIKGLYALDFNNIHDKTRKSYEENQFADEWNNIEHHLKVPSFWNFIHYEKDNRELANKITLLLEIEKGKGKKAEDLFHTYREYEKAFKSNDKPEWRSLSSLYNQLDEWYNFRETYHLMGAVVHLTNTSVHKVINHYIEQSNKKTLNKYLKEVLKDEFFKNENEFKDVYNPDELKYGKKGITSMLLLYNIAVAQLTDKYYKFPFDLFKQVKSWNIEHIYAKNSKGFEQIEDLENWHIELKEIIEERGDLLQNVELQKLWQQIDLKDLEKSNYLIKKIELQLQELLDKDSLSNLCFLDNVTNIQVGNKVFRKKREMILEISAPLNEGAYVPVASKMVFQKSLTPSNELKINYWNTMDREAYINDIENKIKEFLSL